MPTNRKSTSVPLSLVPLIAATISATACSHSQPIDPCEPDSYTQAACETAVAQRGYWYGGTWYPHVYPYAAMYYLGRHNSFVAGGGRVRSISPTVYVPHTSTPAARPSVVRGGFGGIGSGHVSAGS